MAAATIDSWGELLGGMDSGQLWLIVVIAIGCGTGLVVGVVGILSNMATSIQRHRAEMALKREMIERGMSADEIARIIEASGPAPPEE